MSEGGGNADVPEFLLSSCFLDLLVYRVGCGHDECSEVFGLKDDYVVVIFLSLVMVIVSGQ